MNHNNIDLKITTKKNQIKNKSLELILSSTSHGLPNIFGAKRRSIKLMWLLLFTIFSSIGIYMVYSTITNYLKYEVVTKIDVITRRPIEFPAVTIINLRNPKSNVSLSKIMINCRFNDEQCSENDFEIIIDKLGYVSYKFKKRLSYMIGVNYGLQVLIDLKDDSKKTGYIKGLRLIIHNDTTDPEVHGGYSLRGYNIGTGIQTDLEVSRVFSEKLGEPFNKCLKNLKSLDAFDSDVYRHILTSTNFSYDQKDCYNLCIGQKFNKILNISSEIKHYADVWFGLTPELKPKIIDFYLDVIKGNIKKYCDSACPLQCDSIQYHVSSSFTRFSIETFYEYIKEIFNGYPIKNDDRLLINNLENLIYFNVFYNSFEYTSITQLPKMDIFDLISNIGGNLGLFIGISFLSFAEIIELVLETIHILLEKKSFHSLNLQDN